MSGRPDEIRPDEPTAPGDLPLWLARLHRRLTVDTVIEVRLDPSAAATMASRATITVDDLLTGAGFDRRSLASDPGPSDASGSEPDPRPGDGGDPGADSGFRFAGPLRRLRTLPDWVGPGMRALVVGLNPSPASADGGVNFARPGNRFWPAALTAGLVSADRDPDHAVTVDRVGFTDLVKRTTRTAAELTAAEFSAGSERLDRLVTWLRPEVTIVVGLMGWRAAVDRGAVAGFQQTMLGDRPVYLMPNTSGLNAHSSLDDFVDHFRAALDGCDCHHEM